LNRALVLEEATENNDVSPKEKRKKCESGHSQADHVIEPMETTS
jgi:hypothetical protein